MEEVESMCSQDPPTLRRRRRSASRPRHNEKADAAAKLARRIALLGAEDGHNIDIECSVQGVTHRGAIKFQVLKLEKMTGSMVDKWRFLCTSHGYFPEISFHTSRSEASIVCTPMASSLTCPSFAPLAKLHPLTALSVLLVVVNVGRHLLL